MNFWLPEIDGPPQVFQDDGQVKTANNRDGLEIDAPPNSNWLSIIVKNTDGTDNILVSFTDGKKWTTLEPDDSISIEFRQRSFKIKGSAANVSYEFVGVYARETGKSCQ